MSISFVSLFVLRLMSFIQVYDIRMQRLLRQMMHSNGFIDVQVRGLGFDQSRVVGGDTNCEVRVRALPKLAASSYCSWCTAGGRGIAVTNTPSATFTPAI